MNDKTVIKAHGKINLSLDIIGRRPDGYHEVSMIMQSVSLADELVFEKTDVAGLKLRLGNLPSDDPEEQDTQGRSCGGTNCEPGTSVSHEGGMLPALPKCSILLVHPDIPVSTKDVYNAYDRASHTFHPDISAIKSFISKGDLKGMCALAGNVLEEATIPMHPEINDIKNKVKEFAPLLSLMTGSGPTVFGIFDDEAKAREAYGYFKTTRYSGGTILTEPI